VSQAISPYLGVHPVVGGLYTIDFECGQVSFRSGELGRIDANGINIR
jgi:hypothetical protein